MLKNPDETRSVGQKSRCSGWTTTSLPAERLVKAHVSDLFSTQSGRNRHEQRPLLISRRSDKLGLMTSFDASWLRKKTVFDLSDDVQLPKSAWKIKTEQQTLQQVQ